MTPPNATQAARHTGGWIVMGGLFLLACLYFQLPKPTAPQLKFGTSIELGIDVNRASSAELACIPGVGDNLAERIVSYRESHGPFQSLSQLQQVPGIGPAKAAQLAEALLPIEEQTPRIAASPMRPNSASTGKK